MATQEHTPKNGDCTSVSIEDSDDEALANSMEARLYDDSPLSAKCCIFRIPEVFRRHNVKAYEPDVIAIGPFHHGKPSLRLMQEVKEWYLRTLLSRLNISMLSLVKHIKEFEKRARDCYQAPIGLDQNEFIEMLIIDGCFLVELFLKDKFSSLRNVNDPIFNMDCMHQFLDHDLLLLENQLPWFVLQGLFDLIMGNDQSPFSLTEFVLHFFRNSFAETNLSMSTSQSHKEILHIVDLIRKVLTSSLQVDQSDRTSCQDGQSDGMPKWPKLIPCVTNLVEAGKKFTKSSLKILCQDDQSDEMPDWPKLIPCVTNLVEAGVKFTKSSSNNMTDIEFKDGTFKIPLLFILENTESIFRNLIAFEQCYHRCVHEVTSYAVLMDNLINTSKDVEILSDKGIIFNWLSAEDASQFFNRLYNDTSVKDFFYDDVCKRVDEHCQKKWHKWRAILMRDYFKTPWTIISLVAGFLLLVLTFLQTFYSIKQS